MSAETAALHRVALSYVGREVDVETESYEDAAHALETAWSRLIDAIDALDRTRIQSSIDGAIAAAVETAKRALWLSAAR